MKSLLLITLFVAFYLICFSQTTYKENFGGVKEEQPSSFAVSKNESILVAGAAFPYGGGPGDIYCVSVDKNGNRLWEKKYDSRLSESNIKCAATADNGFVLAAQLTDTNHTPKGAIVIKSNKDGDVIWSKKLLSQQYSYLYPLDILENSDGSITLLLEKFNASFDTSIIGIVHFDDHSNISWQTSVYVSQDRSSLRFHDPLFFTQTGNGGFAVAGHYNNDFSGIESSSMLLVNGKGKPVAFKTIAYNNNAFYDDVTLLKNIYEKNNRFTVLGYHYGDEGPDKYFSLNFDNNDSIVNDDLIAPDLFSIQNYFLKNIKARGLTITRNYSYLAKDGGLVIVTSGNFGGQHTDFYIQEYDSLGRICPDYRLPLIDTTVEQGSFEIRNNTTYNLVNDSLYIQNMDVHVAELSTENITCIGVASQANSSLVFSPASENKKDQTSVTVYPNPAADFIVLKFLQSATSNVNIDIISQQGKVVTSLKELVAGGEIERTFNIQSLPAGVYLIRIITGNQQTFTKFIKQ